MRSKGFGHIRTVSLFSLVLIGVLVVSSAVGAQSDFLEVYSTTENTEALVVIVLDEPVAARVVMFEVETEKPRVHEFRAFSDRGGEGENLFSGLIPVFRDIKAGYQPEMVTDGITSEDSLPNKWFSDITPNVMYLRLPEETTIARFELDVGYANNGVWFGQPDFKISVSRSDYTVSELEALIRSEEFYHTPEPAISRATFHIPTGTSGTLKVFDRWGTEVWSTEVAVGVSSLTWNLTDFDGQRLEDGNYLYVLVEQMGVVPRKVGRMVIER